MLSDEQIEQLLYKYTSRQDEFSMSVIKIIADRVANLAAFDRVDILGKEKIMQEDIARINFEYAKYINDQKKRIIDDLWWIATVIYLESQRFYEEQIALKKNKALMGTVSAFTTSSQKNLSSLLSRPVFVLRDLKAPKVIKPYSLNQTYRTVINEALTYSNVSDELRDVALNRTETQLFDSGVRYMITNSSDNTQSVTNANSSIRMNMLDNVRSFINKMQEIMGKQFGANALELSAHVFPAPDHAPAQGHQFSKEEVEKMQAGLDFKDLQGNSYVGFERNIGEWNCRHYFMQIKQGAEPQYTQKQLDKILEDNERGYTDENGVHRTLYECTQVQRRYEREIRQSKERYLYGKYFNKPTVMASARNRVGRLTTQYKQFSQKCGLPAKLERIKVKDYT